MSLNGDPFNLNSNLSYYSSVPQTRTLQGASTAANPIPAHLTPANSIPVPAHLTPAQKYVVQMSTTANPIPAHLNPTQRQAELNKLHLQQLTGILNQQNTSNNMVAFQVIGQQNPFSGSPSNQSASAQYYQTGGVSTTGNWNVGPQTSLATPVGTTGSNQSFGGPGTLNPSQTVTTSTSSWYPPTSFVTSFLPSFVQPVYMSTPAVLPPPPAHAAASVPVPIKKRQKKNAVPLPSTFSDTSATAEPMVTTPAPPTPPGWDKTLESAFTALTPFARSEVPHASFEHSVLSELVPDAATLQVNKIERIVNPGLWKKFTATRKELMTSKSDDWSLLSGLGLNDSELQLQAHVFLNFDPPPGIPSYADNVALLFHCTRGNVDAVLSQGLDERLGRDQGLLGRGIYFTDDPMKSINYDGNGVLILFAVFLGDCFSVDHIGIKNNFVREPEKVLEQRRNHSDLFFDSIVGRPAGVNEFVIYNRYQCVPLYLLHYTRNAKAYRSWKQTSLQSYASARLNLPPFAWSAPRSATPLVCPSRADKWPFFAQTIFNLMAAPSHLPPAPPPVTAPVQLLQDFPVDPEEGKKLNTLLELGFTDVNQNIQKLAQFGGNLERAVNALLDPSPPPTSHAQSAAQPTAQPAAQPLNLITHASTYYPHGNLNSTTALSMHASTSSATQLNPHPKPPAGFWGKPITGVLTQTQEKQKRQDNLTAIIEAVATGQDLTTTTAKPKTKRMKTSKKPPPAARPNAAPQPSAATAAATNAHSVNGNIINLYPTDLKSATDNLTSNTPHQQVNAAAVIGNANYAHSSAAGSSTNPYPFLPISSSSSYVGSGIAMPTPTTTNWNFPATNMGLLAPSNAIITSPGVSASSSLTSLASLTSTLCSSQPVTQTSSTVNMGSIGSHVQNSESEDCQICYNETPPWMWEELKCSHKLCSACHERIKTSGRTMSGEAHTFVKCPFCQGVSGTEIGTCPDGTMYTVKHAYAVEGYEGYGCISVNYVVNSGKYQLNRTGYLPATAEGERLANLLRIAWDRRLVFSLGTSMTTGHTDVLVWNIHHKTGVRGGVQAHAYPDPTYLDRLKEELRQYAIE